MPQEQGGPVIPLGSRFVASYEWKLRSLKMSIDLQTESTAEAHMAEGQTVTDGAN
jgi:hypothetical protein